MTFINWRLWVEEAKRPTADRHSTDLDANREEKEAASILRRSEADLG